MSMSKFASRADYFLDIIRRCHEALGESGDSDHDSLPEAIATHIRERNQRIAELYASPTPEHDDVEAAKRFRWLETYYDSYILDISGHSAFQRESGWNLARCVDRGMEQERLDATVVPAQEPK